jgi:hypothetical protein
MRGCQHALCACTVRRFLYSCRNRCFPAAVSSAVAFAAAFLLCTQEYLLTPPDQLMQVLMGVIKAHMTAEPGAFKVGGG